MFFPPWFRVKFIAAHGNNLQLVFWGESWSKPHLILPACWTEHMATVPPVQPRKHWCTHSGDVPHHPNEHWHALVHGMGSQTLDSPTDHRSPSEVTHHADFQFVSLHGFQPHQGIDRAAHQDLVSHVELEDVGKLLGITWGKKTLHL